MTDSRQVAESVGRRYAVLRRHLDERQRRLVLGSEAAELGRGGIKAVAEATGVHPDTVARGFGSWRAIRSRRFGCGPLAVAASGCPSPIRN